MIFSAFEIASLMQDPNAGHGFSICASMRGASTPTISGPRDDEGWERLLDGAESAKLSQFGARKGLKLLHTQTKSWLELLLIEASDAGNQELRYRRTFQGPTALADLNFQPSPANFLRPHFLSLRP